MRIEKLLEEWDRLRRDFFKASGMMSYMRQELTPDAERRDRLMKVEEARKKIRVHLKLIGRTTKEELTGEANATSGDGNTSA
jgi:hypothetical protein